jgi:hypothetical protein
MSRCGRSQKLDRKLQDWLLLSVPIGSTIRLERPEPKFSLREASSRVRRAASASAKKPAWRQAGYLNRRTATRSRAASEVWYSLSVGLSAVRRSHLAPDNDASQRIAAGMSRGMRRRPDLRAEFSGLRKAWEVPRRTKRLKHQLSRQASGRCQVFSFCIGVPCSRPVRE